MDVEQLEASLAVRHVGDLIALLRARGGVWREALADDAAVCVAVNQQMATCKTAIVPGDEIAFFPPVTGG